MCGRFTLTTDLREIAERFGVNYPRGFAGPPSVSGPQSSEPSTPTSVRVTPRWNIAPTQTVIVVNDAGERQLVPMRWGLVPSWAKAEPLGAARRSSAERKAEGRAERGILSEYKPSITPIINARAETIAEKPAFRAALKKRRCIIPADGFYEWTTKPVAGPLPPAGDSGNKKPTPRGVTRPTTKQPVCIRLKSGEPFGFAGLWEHWTSPDGELLTCTIITTEVNELLKAVHHRMPVILPREAEAVWLDPKIQDAAQLLPLLRPYPSELMEFYPVSRVVNSPANDTPQCIVPI